MYNKVILVGNLTRDIELRYTQNGSAIAKTGIATTRKFKSNGETKEELLFVDLTFFGRSGEIANQYLKKGSKVLVEGRLILEQWTTQDGSKRSKHSVVVESMQMLGAKQDNTQQEQSNYQENSDSSNVPKQTKADNPQQPTIPEIDIDEDEIPF